MAYHFLYSPDIRDARLFASSNGISYSASYARTGSYGMSMAYQSSVTIAFPQQSAVYLKVGVYYNGTPGSTGQMAWQYVYRGVNQLGGMFDFWNDRIQVRRGAWNTGTVLAQQGPLPENRWNLIEMYCVIHDTTGEVIVKNNGAEYINITGQDTRATTYGALVEGLIFYANGSNMLMDDFALRDDDWCGQGGVYLLTPDGAGSNTAWAGTYADVDEVPPDGVATISTDAATTGTKEEVTLSAMPSMGSPVIRCFSPFAKGWMTAPGAGNIRVYTDSNGTVANGDSTAMDSAASCASDFLTADPDTASAWTESGINAVKIGVETI